MISLLTPTRGRPSNMQRFVESAYETATLVTPEVIFYVDEDDLDSIGMAAQLNVRFPHVRTRTGPRTTLSQCWNLAAELATGDVLGVMGDDIVFRSPGWDERLTQQFAMVLDGVLMVHGRDGMHDARFGTHCFISRTWYEACGELFPGIYESEWVDTHLNDVANALDRRVYDEAIYTEHMHFANGKAAQDTTYTERIARHTAQNTNQVYAGNTASRERDIAILKALMEAGQ